MYILGSLNRTAPNTVIINLVLKNDLKKLKIISLNKSNSDNYKDLLDKYLIEYKEYNSFKYALLDIFNIKKELKEYDLIHLNTYHPNVYGFLLRKIGVQKKIIATCHAVENQEAVINNRNLISKLKSFIRLQLHKYIYKRQDKTIAVSNEVFDYLSSIGCDKKKTIYNGVDYDSFPSSFNTEKNIKSSDTLNICQVGHVSFLKNQKYSLKLILFLKSKGINVKMHFFGSIDTEKEYYLELSEIISSYNLENSVFFYGSLQFKELFKELSKMDILIMPSFSEGLPLALLEGFYYSLPAVVSNNGGMKEVIEEGKNGLVIDLNNDEEFERIYQYIFSGNYITNGNYARKIAINKFSANKMASEYLHEYNKLF